MNARLKSTTPARLPTLQLVDKETVLSEYNIRCQHADFMLLHNCRHGGRSLYDMSAYAFIGDQLFAVHREVFFGHPDGDLRVFLGDAPVVIDITEAFRDLSDIDSAVDITPALQKLIVRKCAAAREAVISYWVDALKQAPHTLNLAKLMDKMEPVSLPARYAPNGIDEEVARVMGYKPFSDQTHMLRSLMTRQHVCLPTWAGTVAVGCQVYMRSEVASRHWVTVKCGVYTPMGNLLAKLRLDQGPLAVVTAASDEARAACEELINSKKYGDIVLFIGEGKALKEKAQRMSDYLLGVDIIEM